MKRSLVALVVVLAVSAAGCGGTKKSSSGGGSSKLADAPGFSLTGKEIHVGVITPLTGPVALIGKPLTAGTETWFAYYNAEKGGIGGKYKVVLDEKDSQYVPQTGVQAYQQIKDSVAVIGQLLGTPVTKAVLPLLKQDNVVAAPASLDADWVRNSNLLPIGGPYQIQMINAADYLINEGGFKGKTFCSMIQDDAYGQAGQQGIDFAAKQLSFTVKTTARYPSGNPDFTPQIQQLKNAACDVVFIVSTPSDTGKAFGTSAQLNFAPQWVGQSPSYIGALAKSPLAPYLQAHFLLASEGTEWGDTTVKGQVDMLQRMAKYKPDQQPDYYFAFGYEQAWAVTDLLEKAVSLGDLSRAGIKKALTSLGKESFDGLTGDYQYGPVADRNPPRATTIFKINPAKPIGIEKVKVNFVTDTAKKFKFAA